ncbi:MAG: hypothetical protein AAFZ38_05255 [Myxococcota bacterium]
MRPSATTGSIHRIASARFEPLAYPADPDILSRNLSFSFSSVLQASGYRFEERPSPTPRLERPESASAPTRYALRSARSGYDGYFEFIPSGPHVVQPPAVLVFLHGLGERGNGDSELTRLLRNGPPRLIQDGEWPGQNSVAVFAPQNPGPERCHRPERLRRFIDDIRERYADRVDTSHIVLAGYSCGAHAGWNYLAHYHEDLDVVGLLLVSGSPLRNEEGAQPQPGETTALQRLAQRQQSDLVPIRIAFDEQDTVVSPETSFPEAELRRANIGVWVDRLHGYGHGTSTPYFARPELVPWILDPIDRSPNPLLARDRLSRP